MNLYELDKIIEDLQALRESVFNAKIQDKRIEIEKLHWCNIFNADYDVVWSFKSRTLIHQEVRGRAWLSLRSKYGYTYKELAMDSGYEPSTIVKTCRKFDDA